MIVGSLKFVSGALLKASTTNTYTATRADVKTSALDALAALDPDALTPRQALEALYRLKALA
jgi:hypothetical protein